MCSVELFLEKQGLKLEWNMLAKWILRYLDSDRVNTSVIWKTKVLLVQQNALKKSSTTKQLPSEKMTTKRHPYQTFNNH